MGEYKSLNKIDYTPSKRFPLGGMYGDVTKEVSIGTWGGKVKLDIRKWKGLALGKGISLTADEVRELRKILDEIDFGR